MKKLFLALPCLLLGLSLAVQAWGQCTPNARNCPFPPDSLGIPFCLDPVPVPGRVGQPYDHTFQLAVRKNLSFPGVPLPLPITRLEIVNVSQVPEGLTFELVNGNAADPAFQGRYPYTMRPPRTDPAPDVGIFGCGRISGTPTRANSERPFIQLEVRVYLRFIVQELTLKQLLQQFAPDIADSIPDPLPLPLPLLITDEDPIQLTVDAGPDQRICAGQSAQLGVRIEPDGQYPVAWAPAASLDNPNSRTPTATPTQTTTYVVTVLGPSGPVRDTVRVEVLPLPRVEVASVEPVGCTRSGRLNLRIDQGRAPYALFLNDNLEASEVPGAFSTSIETPGNYRIRVVDAAGCEARAEADVPGSAERPRLRLTLIQAVGCNGEPGAVSYRIEGGQPPLEIYLNGMQVGSQSDREGAIQVGRPGVAQVRVVDAAGCEGEASIEVPGAPPFKIDLVARSLRHQADAADRRLVARARIGTPPIEYSIDNGQSWQARGDFRNLRPGRYEVQARDAAGCTIRRAVVLN